MGMGFSLKLITVSGVAALTMSVAACKLPEMQKEAETLTKSSADNVRDALWAELDKVDLHQLKPGQYAFYESNYRAENASVVKVVDVERLVRTVEDTATNTKVVMAEAYRSYNPNGSIEDDKVSDIIWNLQKSTMLNSMSLNMGEFQTMATSDYDYAEYYNLTAKRTLLDPPAATRARANCGGFTNCKINAYEVSYLAHLIKDGQVVKRIEYNVVLSSEIPAVFWDETNPIWPVLSECMSYTVQNIYVNECVVLRDAQK